MSKQLTQNQWMELFQIYETSNLQSVWNKLGIYKKLTNSKKSWFKSKYRKFLSHNKDMNVLISKTGKSVKKTKKLGRPKISKTKEEIWKDVIKELGDDEVASIFKRLADNDDEEFIKILNEIIKKSKLSSRQIARIANISKSTICNLRNSNYSLSIKKNNKKEKLEKWIYDIFIEFKGNYGRRKIANELSKRHDYVISDRQVGIIMNKKGLFCQIRRPKRTKEQKNTSVKIEDLVLRDYDNKNHTEEIFATDVTYIEAPYDAIQNHVYFSVIMHHRTKEIIGAKLSMYNNTKLVNDSFISMKYKPKNAIIHSDHGACYSSLSFTNMIKQNNWKQSMSRVGNSLDNRVVEFWFSILKTELIYKLNIKKMSFKELENEIMNFIDYYNNVRTQEKLNWMPPSRYKEYLYNKNV